MVQHVKAWCAPMVGASWLDNQPDNVGITIQLFNEIANIHSVSFNIDGEMITLKPLGITRLMKAVGASKHHVLRSV